MKRRKHLSRTHVAIAGLLGVAAVAILPGCESGQAEDSAGAGSGGEVAVNVRTLSVTRGELNEYLSVTGALRPVQGTDVSTEETGVVAAVERDKGSVIGRGEVFLRLERSLLAAERDAAAAGAKLATYDVERSRELFEAGKISEQEMLSVEASTAEATSRAEIARRRFERAAVRAPFDGVVADRFVEAGQLVAAGTPVGRIVDPYTLELEGAISEREVAWISPGAPATVTVAGQKGAFAGRVHWVSLEANPTTGKFQVEVRVDNRALALRPGVVARAEVLKQVHENAVVVPRDAILLLPEGAYAFVVKNDRAERRELELGPDQGLMTAVQSGLNPGDELVVRGQRDLRPGALVDVRERADAPDGSAHGDPEEIRAAAAADDVPLPATSSEEAPR
ncbi:MAG: efflux RND transporter periplasmic adaptor subunit [bacterium]